MQLRLDDFTEMKRRQLEERANAMLQPLVQPEKYVGEVYSMSYEEAVVIVHDSYRREVGGIPGLSFLVASRILPQASFNPLEEDSSVLLLRVMDAAPLPDHSEAERRRAEIARRASGHDTGHWDEKTWMDLHTNNELSFAGVRCRIIGTFYAAATDPQDPASLELRFGSDISNYYPNRGLKVYKPVGEALARIVNFRDPRILAAGEPIHPIRVGTVRYASTNRSYQDVDTVPVLMAPEDLLGQKTALFGMTRTGKSNTTKVMVQSVFKLRDVQHGRRIGQLVFDPNGEYANENEQDASGQGKNPNAVKNLGGGRSGRAGARDVITYGILEHPLDPDRILMKLNFYEDENLQLGKDHIDIHLVKESAGYIKQFCDVSLIKPDADQFSSEMTRYRRLVLAYRSLLSKAGFEEPKNVRPDTTKLFNQRLLKALASSTSDKVADYVKAANTLKNPHPSWSQLADALASLAEFMHEGKTGYSDFEREYMDKDSTTGEPWANDDLKKVLEMLRYPYGSRRVGAVKKFHSASTGKDYAEQIYDHLVAGRLVIIDQSSGDYETNKTSAERVVQHIFDEQQDKFRSGTPREKMPEILVYVEEAHNLLPAGEDTNYRDIWVKTAKEGAKYHIGLVYATQEVSSIQRNILKNTSNWFIGHLNNTDETRELGKYYDFADFLPSIRRASDKGFLRVKTMSNLYVVPAQIDRFEVQ